MSNVVKLTTAPNTFFTVMRDQGAWAVVLVTPMPGNPRKTGVAWLQDRDTAIRLGRNAAHRAMRPFKLRGVE